MGLFRVIFEYVRSILERIGLLGEIHLKDNVTIELIKNGVVVHKQTVHNLVTTDGKHADAGLFNGVITAPFKWVGIGTGTAAPATGDAALGSEITGGGGARGTSGTCTRVSGTTSADTAQIVKQFDFSASYAVTESGLFDASASGTLGTRQTFAAVNVGNGDSLQVTWKVQKT